jgi:shikimate kinase
MEHLQDRPVFLMGYRGTGKTTVARLLAERLEYDWVDADDQVERLAGKSIAAIFADQGEQAFRDLEAHVVADLCSRRRLVVALGGGAVLREANRAAICQAGPVVWLTAGVDTIARRMGADRSTTSRRPNLTRAGVMAEIETVLTQREPIYRACATFEVDTDTKTPAEIADLVLARLETQATKDQ